MAGFGETLHQARAHMGVTLKQAEQATRINRHHLAALEEENFAALPPLIYQRGIVRNYATYLQLDPGKLLAMFEEAHGGTVPPERSLVAPAPVNMPSHWAPNFAIISFALVLAAIVSAWLYSAFVAQPDIEVTPTAPAPTATAFDSELQVPTQVPTQVPPTAVPTEEPAQAQESSAGSRETSNEDGQDRQRGGDNQVNDDAAAGEVEPTGEPESAELQEAETTEVETEAPRSDIAEADLTSIMVTANAELYVTVVADGVIVFDGTLVAGSDTGFLTGNTFEVTTSWGEQTIFTNACGGEFTMGYESGSTTYVLEKNPDSCPPIRQD